MSRVSTTVAVAFLISLQWTAARAECKVPVGQTSLKEFTHRPARFLDHFPSGGDGLARSVREFATFNREGLQAIKGATRAANLPQKKAIGGGMALAVAACLARDGEIAKQIADVIKDINDVDVTNAYLAVSDGAPDTDAAPSVTIDSPDPKGIRPGGSLALPSTAVPNLVPDLK